MAPVHAGQMIIQGNTRTPKLFSKFKSVLKTSVNLEQGNWTKQMVLKCRGASEKTLIPLVGALLTLMKEKEEKSPAHLLHCLRLFSRGWDGKGRIPWLSNRISLSLYSCFPGCLTGCQQTPKRTMIYPSTTQPRYPTPPLSYSPVSLSLCLSLCHLSQIQILSS